MFQLPIYFGGDEIPLSRLFHFRDMEDHPSYFGRCQGNRRPRCQRSCGGRPMMCQSGQTFHGWHCPMSTEDFDPENSTLHDLLRPLLSTVGQHLGQACSQRQREPCCRQMHSSPEPIPEQHDSKGYPEVDFLNHFIGASNESNQSRDANIVSEILKNLFQVDGDSNKKGGPKMKKTSQWLHKIDCTGFRPDNIFVKMAGGDVVVKAVREEHGRDGSVSVRRLEKRIPVPKDVITEKIMCKLQDNSTLKIEGPREDAKNNSKTCNNVSGKEYSSKKKAHEPNIMSSNNGWEVKTLPNGAIVVTSSIPNFGATCEGFCQPGKGAESKDNDSETKDDILVQHVSADETHEEPHMEPQDDEGSTSERNVDEGVARKESVEDKSEPESVETCLMTPVVDDSMAAPEDPIKNEDSEDEEAYTVELAESDDDSASTGSKDSDSSFVLLTEHGTPVECKKADESEIEHAMKEVDTKKSKAEEHENNSEQDKHTKGQEGAAPLDNITKFINETVNNNSEQDKRTKGQEGAAPLDNITKFINETVPNLQRFVLNNMNDPSKIPQGAFEPQNFAKMMTDAIPGFQNLVLPQVNPATTKAAPPVQAELVEEKDKKGNFVVRLELPVCIPESIRVTMDDEQRLLHVTAKKKNAGPGESINKSIEVPHSANVTKVRCQYSDGLLTLTAPYKADAKNTRDIPVDV